MAQFGEPAEGNTQAMVQGTFSTASITANRVDNVRSVVEFAAKAKASGGILPGLGFGDAAAQGFSEGLSGLSGGRAVSAGASTASTASKVLGPVCGGLGIAAAVVDVGFAINDLINGNPTTETCDELKTRIEKLAEVYYNEPETPARLSLLDTFGTQSKATEELKLSISLHHNATNVSRIGGNILNGGAGVLFCVSPFTGPAAPVVAGVGIGVGIAGTATTTACTVADSCRNYEFRGKVLTMAREIISAQVSYGKSTDSLHEGLSGEPGRIRFEVPGPKWCQFYMTLEYDTFDDSKVKMMSCDLGPYNWYGAVMDLEPGAKNISVSFDVRGGAQVCAVDQHNPRRPWQLSTRTGQTYREKFFFAKGNGLDALFELAGTSLHAYVDKVTRWQAT